MTDGQGTTSALAPPGSATPGPEVDHATTWWGLRFIDRREEQEYRVWYLDATRFFSRLGLVASLGLWLAVFVGLSVTIDGAFARGAPWCASAIAIVAAALVVTFIARLRVWVPLATALANAAAGLLAIGFAHAVLPSEFDLTLAGMGILTVVFFGFVVFRLHPLPAALAVGSYTIVYGVVITVLFRDGEIVTTRYWVTLVLLVNAYAGGLFICLLIERQQRGRFRAERTIERQSRVIDEQRREADELLLNILPGPIVERLKREPGVIAERSENVTVLFADVVGFTPLSARVAPDDLVDMLNHVFTRFDELADEHGVEKIKTIGDAYMAVGGLPEPRADHAKAVADLALSMRDMVPSLGTDGPPVQFRIGMASGPAVAGVIGLHKFAYDLWGDTVNTAARMESHGVPGQIQVSAATHALLEHSYRMVAQDPVDLKGKGPTEAWLLLGPHESELQ